MKINCILKKILYLCGHKYFLRRIIKLLKQSKVDTLSYKTVSANKATVVKEWILVDAEDQILGRMSSKIAKILRGKHKAGFTPHVDCGDNVVIINAAKVRMTGKKFADRKRIRHSGYPGGQKITNAKEVIKQHPTRVVEMAISRMLPKNRLGSALFRNLYVYEGVEHEQVAQQPRTINLNEIK